MVHMQEGDAMYRAFRVLSMAVGLGLTLGGPTRADDPTAVENDLKEIVLAFHNYLDKHGGTAPTKAADLTPSLEKRARDRLESKSVVFVYGVRLKDMIEGSSRTIVAYENDAPEKGGRVAYGDGSVRKLTADEFKKAVLAKAPKK